MNKGEIGIIGGGNMGRAIAERLTTGRQRRSVTVASPNIAKLRTLGLDNNVKLTQSNPTAAERAEVVIMAVKPQIIKNVLREIADYVDGKLLISVAAGTPLQAIRNELPSETRVVRAMPNLGAQVAESMTAWTAGDDLSKLDVRKINSILGTLGDVMQVRDDDAIDRITAIAGSGPAYFFYVAEAMVEQCVAFGFDEEQAYMLIRQTLRGAAHVLDDSGKHPGALREAVTSPGGTTQAATEVFDRRYVQHAVRAGIRAAYERARELSGE